MVSNDKKPNYTELVPRGTISYRLTTGKEVLLKQSIVEYIEETRHTICIYVNIKCKVNATTNVISIVTKSFSIRYDGYNVLFLGR